MHLSQLPSGSWRAIVQHDGRRRSVTRPTKAAARLAGAQLVIELGATPHDAGGLVGELLDVHLTEQKLAATSLANYEFARRHIPAEFEARHVGHVTPPVIDALYRQLEREGASAHQVRKVHSLLSGAFKRAVRWGWMSVNPCRDADVPSEPEPDTHTPTSDEARQLLAACDARSWDFGLFARVAANTGARRGQVLGMQRGDVTGRQVRIMRGVTYTTATGLVVGELKGGKRERRPLAIGEGLADRLVLHMMIQAEALPGLGDDAWLFTADGRRPWFPDTPTHWWVEARAACGIDDVRIHDLRHYVATEGFAGDFDPRTVMSRLGHTRMATTMERYASTRQARDQALAEHIERELGA